LNKFLYHPTGVISIQQCQIPLPKITDHRGNLTAVIENKKKHPFEIKRVYYLYDAPGGAQNERVMPHKALHQFLVAMSAVVLM